MCHGISIRAEGCSRHRIAFESDSSGVLNCSGDKQTSVIPSSADVLGRCEGDSANDSDGIVMAGGTPPALQVLAFAGFGPVVFALCKLQSSSQKTFEQVLLNVVVSFLGFLLTKRLIPILKPICLRRGLFGKDINKKGGRSLHPHCTMCNWGWSSVVITVMCYLVCSVSAP